MPTSSTSAPLDERISYGVTLRPSAAEFADFRRYIYAVASDPRHRDLGFVKIVPPKSFAFKRRSLRDALASLTVKRPLDQQVIPRYGLNELVLVQKGSMSLADYRELVYPDEAPLAGRPAAEVERQVT